MNETTTLPTLIDLPAGAFFPGRVVEALSDSGFSCREEGYSVFCWLADGVWHHQEHGMIANGWMLRRFASKGLRIRLAVTPRVSLVGNDHPDLPAGERAAISRLGYQRKDFTVTDRLRGCRRVIAALEAGLNSPSSLPVIPESLGDICQIARWELGEEASSVTVQGSLWSQLRSKGVRSPTQEGLIRICSEAFPPADLKRLAQSFTAAFQSVKSSVTVSVIDFQEAEKMAAQTNCSPGSANTVMMVGITGGKGDPVPERTRRLLDLLDGSRVPYRVFADQTLRNAFAVNDQVPHLCELAGIASYRVCLETKFDDAIFIGFDLGHPKGLKRSIPVMTVVDFSGSLLGYWRGEQPRDETLRRQTLENARNWLCQFARDRKLDPDHAVVLRDGRRFENDGLEQFIARLPWESTLVEVVKSPVPLLVDGDQPAKPGTLCELEEDSDGLLQTVTPMVTSEIGQPIRLRVIHNPRNFTLRQLAGAIFSLCHAPSLGLRSTRIPAPIYWSDGLAREAGQSIQFRGLHHIPHN